MKRFFIILSLTFVCITMSHASDIVVDKHWDNPIFKRNMQVYNAFQLYDLPSFNFKSTSSYQGGIYLSTTNMNRGAYSGVIGNGSYENTSFGGGRYSSSPMYIGSSSGIISFEDGLLGANNGQNNTCVCGATYFNSNNPHIPPCKCHHWMWNGKKWVHNGGGNMKTCDCEGEEHNTPIGDIPMLLFFMIICYIIYNNRRLCLKKN